MKKNKNRTPEVRDPNTLKRAKKKKIWRINPV
jgi:hypothetical protein